MIRTVQPVGYLSALLFALGAIAAAINAFDVIQKSDFSFGWLGVALGLAGLVFLPFVRYG